jgi:hypothetical protein
VHLGGIGAIQTQGCCRTATMKIVTMSLSVWPRYGTLVGHNDSCSHQSASGDARLWVNQAQ